MSRGSDPEKRLLTIFDVFDERFHRDDFEACSFINVLLEMGPEHPAGGASIWHLEQIRSKTPVTGPCPPGSSTADGAPMRPYALGCTQERAVRARGGGRLAGDGVAGPVRLRLE